MSNVKDITSTEITHHKEGIQNMTHEPQYEKNMEDLITSFRPAKNSLNLALTKCNIPTCGPGRQLTAELKCESVPADVKEPGPTFFCVGGYLMDGDPEYCYVLYWKDRMIMSNSIECSDKKIIFQDASIYIRTPDNRKSSKRSHDNYKWQESGESEDLGFPLEKNTNKYIQTTYLHWHNLFCFDGNELRLKNSTAQKSWLCSH